MELLSFSEIYLSYWTENRSNQKVYVFFCYSIILQQIKISMLVFNAIKFTYLLLDKTFPVKT
jgi:hypothetical protein